MLGSQIVRRAPPAAYLAILLSAALGRVAAQQAPLGQAGFAQGRQAGLVGAAPAVGAPGGLGVGAAGAGGAAGGAALADFDSLIDLISSTVAPDTWAENGGGEAEIRPFPTGVWIDPAGVLTTAAVRAAAEAGKEPRTRAIEPTPATAGIGPSSEESNPRRAAAMRCISLPRLEAEIARRAAAGEKLDESMLTLAGLRRVERWWVVPPRASGIGQGASEPGDLVIAGPAGDWFVDDRGRILDPASRDAVVRLDDLVTLLRRERARPGEPLGCAITPRAEGLAAAQAELDRWAAAPLPPGQRRAWLAAVRDALGRQDVEVFGLDPATNAARVLVEADHHMKRVGLGDAPGVPGVPSYLDRIAEAARDGAEPPALTVLRWWFAAEYDALQRSADGLAYALRGRGVVVLCENELLTRRGQRVHTGRSDAHSEAFAADFSRHFAELSREHPVYGELRNVFDLAVFAAVVQADGLTERAGWESVLLMDSDRLPTPRLRYAREVETMATSRVVQRRRVLAAVSGGAWLEPARLVRAEPSAGPASPPRGGQRRRQGSQQDGPQNGGWWWDAAP